jgi:YfiH family protein
MAIRLVRSPVIPEDGFTHGFPERTGGVSTGPRASLNLGVRWGDSAENVAENRRRVAVAAGYDPARLQVTKHVHGVNVFVVGDTLPVGQKDEYDALVTDRPGLLLGIVTADCAPVLFADREAGVVGAAHAGWRGARGGVLENTIEAMERIGARRARIAAAIGPTIAQPSYEVDVPFRDRFNAADARFFATGRPGHWQFDLEGYVAARLERAGVGVIARLGLDTYSDEARFFSHRRSVHRGELNYGRQISLIGVPN